MSSPDSTGEAPPMPTSARVAVGLMGTLAVLLLLYSAITWLGREGLAEAIGRAQPEMSADEAARYVIVSALPYLDPGGHARRVRPVPPASARLGPVDGPGSAFLWRR